jgi:hypothetical protein
MMAYTLDQFSADCRAALQADPGPKGREKVRQAVERALRDRDFVVRHLGPQEDSPRKILYEDPDLKFCILAHVYEGARGSPPHDHGPSWAIYGQAAGVTEMTDWKLVARPAGDAPGKVILVRTYNLEPGVAHLYNEGDLHSPRRESTTRLIRIEGRNLDQIKRDRFVAV